MVHVLRVSGLPGRAMIWVRAVGPDRVIYLDESYLSLKAQDDGGPWKTDVYKGRKRGA